MGPKTFTTCYICFKEFGSRSISFHEPKCLERWRSSNKSLPAEKRTPTPVKATGKNNNCSANNNTWVCSHCQTNANISEDSSVCVAKKLKSDNNSPNPKHHSMTGVVKTDFSPKKGKENKNSSNHIPVPSIVKKNAKNEAKTEYKEMLDPIVKDTGDKNNSSVNPLKGRVAEDVPKIKEDISSTSKRSVRPQTKILRRPTPNLKHPVIQVDSDDSSGDSSCSDKSKDDNPKRLKMGNESSDSAHKPKNFIMYNKNNVDKNTKNAVKEKPSVTMVSSIPNPCNSCNRSLAPERLHSHAKKDSRGLMYRKSPTLDVKMTSPQKKLVSETTEKRKAIVKDAKSAQVKEVPPQINTQECGSDTKNESVDIVLPSDENCSATKMFADEKELTDLVKACYICQKEFNISALLLHESRCLEEWKKTNNSLTPNLRKLPPRRPKEDEDELPPNQADPSWTSVQSQLVPCSVCGRTFFPERLPVHRRVCKGKTSPAPLKRASSLREQSASSRDGDDQKPAALYVPCYVCGRNYGSWVISMHEQQCLRKWKGENDKLSHKEQQEETEKFSQCSPDDDVASLVELGDNAWESHLQQLVPCPLCARTFFPDRLGVHKRSCKGPACSSRRPRSNKGA